MKTVCTKIVSGKWGLAFHALPICWLLDEKYMLILNKLWMPDSQVLQINSAQTRSRFVEFGRDKTPPALRGATRRCEALRLQHNSEKHNICNCWNSVAVMFELRCSEFELDCSETAGQPQDPGG
jgi:hypothetical protein